MAEGSALAQRLGQHAASDPGCCAIQVGYGLVHDLWAIAAALGDEGLGCVAVVEPQLDVGTLHRQLHKAHVPGISKVGNFLPLTRPSCTIMLRQCSFTCRLVLLSAD